MSDPCFRGAGSARFLSLRRLFSDGASSLKIVSINLVLFFCAITFTASAQTYTTLYSFSGGVGPASTSLQGADGNFYGTFPGVSAPLGDCASEGGCGAVFSITAGGMLATLGSFATTAASYPNSGLVQDADGDFFGTTVFGGSGTGCNEDGPCGTVFELSAGGNLALLYSFTSPGPAYPEAGLILGNDGNFYGTTSGVASTLPNDCCGTIFKLTPSGVLTTLYTFPTAGGAYPAAPLVQGTDGNFYGTTTGTVFQITPAGALSTLHSFCTSGPPCSDGTYPNALIQGADGNYYGTTQIYGANNGGTVFQITSAGVLTTLYSFCALANCADGTTPRAGLVQGSDGNFYGTTYSGGSGVACTTTGGCGTIVELSPEPGGGCASGSNAGNGWCETVLYSFCSQANCADGSAPIAGLLQAADTVFYGTTTRSGANSAGTFFSLSNGLSGSTASTTSLSLSPSSVTVGSTGSVTLTATVAPASGAGTPTGTVAFSNGSTYIGTTPLVAGVGTLNYGAGGLAVGTYQITAAYSGDATYAVSTSSAQPLTVNPEPPAETPTFSLASGTYTSAQSVTITDTTPGAIVYYTTDGSTPSTNSLLYTGPIAVNATETINAIAVAGGYINSSVASATYTITLAADFQFSASSTSLTISTGQSATATLTVTPENGFDSQVSFSCSGLPSGVTCSFNPTTVTPSGSSAATTTLTVAVSASAALRGPRRDLLRWTYAFLLPCLGVVFCGAGSSRRLRRKSWILGMMGVLVLGAGLSSCASSITSQAQSTQSTITVTATTSGSAAITHSVSLTLAVTQ